MNKSNTLIFLLTLTLPTASAFGMWRAVMAKKFLPAVAAASLVKTGARYMSADDAKKYSKIITYEFTEPEMVALQVYGLTGNIKVFGSDRPTICVQADISANSPAGLEHFTVDSTRVHKTGIVKTVLPKHGRRNIVSNLSVDGPVVSDGPLEIIGVHVDSNDGSQNISATIDIKGGIVSNGPFKFVGVQTKRGETPPAPKAYLDDNSGTVNYTIHVPRGINLQVMNKSGEILVDNVTGPLDLRTIDAINVSGASNSIYARSDLKNVSIVMKELPAKGNVTLVAKIGNNTLTLPRDASAAVKLKGQYSIMGLAMRNLISHGRWTEAALGEGKGNVHISMEAEMGQNIVRSE